MQVGRLTFRPVVAQNDKETKQCLFAERMQDAGSQLVTQQQTYKCLSVIRRKQKFLEKMDLN